MLLLAMVLPFLLLSSCVSIPDTTVCSVAGVMSAGAVCVHTNNDQTHDMTLDEFIAFLKPVPATETTPARDGAKCMSAEDYTKQKTALEVACRELGRRCTYEMKEAIRNLP